MPFSTFFPNFFQSSSMEENHRIQVYPFITHRTLHPAGKNFNGSSHFLFFDIMIHRRRKYRIQAILPPYAPNQVSRNSRGQ